MAADLHIHVMEDGCTEDDIVRFFGNTLGSKHFSIFSNTHRNEGGKPFYEQDWYKRVSSSPNIWVGEVSWLKQAFLSEEEGEFVPDIVAEITEIIGEDLPVCDDSLIAKVKEAYIRSEPHEFYSTEYSNTVIDFLKEHRGKRLYTISW